MTISRLHLIPLNNNIKITFIVPSIAPTSTPTPPVPPVIQSRARQPRTHLLNRLKRLLQPRLPGCTRTLPSITFGHRRALPTCRPRQRRGLGKRRGLRTPLWTGRRGISKFQHDLASTPALVRVVAWRETLLDDRVAGLGAQEARRRGRVP